MKKLTFLTLTILGIAVIFFQGCNSGLPDIKQGEFFVKSSLANKAVAGEEITLYYHIREGEQVECFYITFTDSSQNNDDQFYPVIQSGDSVVSLKLFVPGNCINVYALVVSNYNCRIEGYARTDFLTYTKNGELPEKATGLLLKSYYENGDTLKADSLMKESLLKNPGNLMVLREYWYWLESNERYAQLQLEIDRIKQMRTKEADQKYAILCEGYNWIGQIDSMETYLEKYIASSDHPVFASDLKHNLYYLYFSNNKEFKNYDRLNQLIAQKCPLSKSADLYLEEIIANGIKDPLAESVITKKLNDSKEALYFQALYALHVLKDPARARNAAINYIDFNKKAYFPKSEMSSEVKYIIRMPKIFSLLSEIAASNKESYDYILKAIEYNRDGENLAPLHSKAAQCAFKLKDKTKMEFHLKQICKLGKLLVAQEALNEIYPNSNNTEKLSALYKSIAAFCDSVPDLKFVINASTTVSTSDNKILFINLWSPGCIPCVREIPALNKLRSEFSKENIAWLAADFGKYNDDLPEKFIGWSIYQNNEKVNKALYKISAIPQTYIIDKNRKVRYHSVGFYDYTNEEEKLVLEMLLKEI
ncbi:MAG TPA: TlpA disulfide reductase family protein [Bacteroidales bacterium]|nr:TlpA disulfide reductase family protein [Bacteroidales bacterium]